MSDRKTEKPAVEDIDCLEAVNHLYSYLDGEITDPVQLEKVEHHLGHCRTCYTRTEMERLLSRRIRDAAGDDVPASLQDRLRKMIEKF